MPIFSLTESSRASLKKRVITFCAKVASTHPMIRIKITETSIGRNPSTRAHIDSTGCMIVDSQSTGTSF